MWPNIFSTIIILIIVTCGNSNITTVAEPKHSSGSGKQMVGLSDHTVILLSFDGFKWDYLLKNNLSNFNAIASSGVRAESLKPSFITKTFPNHFTIVTGLYEENHGIVGNEMYDPVFREKFLMSNDPKWWNATPIWITNEFGSNSTKHKSAVIFWPGSGVQYNNHFPYFYMPYNHSYPYHARFEKIIELLGENDPPNFIAGYFDQPDRLGHIYGPYAHEMSKELQILDVLLGTFLNKLKEKKILDKVNIVIVSDHGMAEIKPNQQIVLDDYIDPSWHDFDGYDTYVSLNPKEEYKMKIYKKLKRAPHLKVYLKDEIPEKYHYKHNRRVMPMLLLADEGWIITRRRMNLTRPIGNHGYSNDLKSMHGIFLAKGPVFKKGYTGSTLSNIHIYSLLCHILKIKPLANNGSLDAVKDFLVNGSGISVSIDISKSTAFGTTLIVVIISMVAVVCLGLYLQFRGTLISSYSYRKLRTTTVYCDNMSTEVELNALPPVNDNNDAENILENNRLIFEVRD